MAKLVPIYRGLTVDDAQRLADYLDHRGIESYVDSTQSPLYGMSQGPSAHVLYVDDHIAAYTRQLVRDYSRTWHGGVPKDEADREETGYETGIADRPSDDALVDSTQDQDRPYGPDMHQEDEDASVTRREAPEVEDLIDETGQENFDERIVRFGPDHDIAEEDDHDLLDENIDSADYRQSLDEEETRPADFARRTEYDPEDEG